MATFSIIIVSWNALHHLQRFLPSVTKSSHDDYEIILADNASTDGSAEWVEKNYPDVRIARFDKNYGYCGGNNRGARHANGKYLVFLNNDVEVDPGWLQPLERCLEEDPTVAAAQPRLRAYNQKDHFEYAGAAGGMIDRYGYPFCRGRIFDTVEKDVDQYDQPADIHWASGAALAIRRDLFEELGGFDEDFEFHMEEIDLCWQLWNRGSKVRYCPDSIVYHLGGGSLPMDSPRKTYYNFRNNLSLLFKNEQPGRLWSRLLIRLTLDLVVVLRALLTGKFSECWAVIRAHWAFWLMLPTVLRKRRALMKKRNIEGNPPCQLPLSIVWQYYIKGRKTFDKLPKSE